MKQLTLLFLSLLYFQNAFSFAVSPQVAQNIAEKIWKNECGGTKEGLTFWNAKENFPSLGIGHFIWYPVGKREQFTETFPSLLAFLQEENVQLPSWLTTSKGCPWATRDAFYKDIHSEKMNELRELLFTTRHLQASFIANRLKSSFEEIQSSLPSQDKEKNIQCFHLLSQDPKGLYALIDYLNFKGSGLSSFEAYKGQGWGLKQVLQRIPSSSEEPLVDFVREAKALLKERVQNAPPERNEERFLTGWLNRIDSYLN